MIIIADPQFPQLRIIEMYLIFDAFADDTFAIAAHNIRAIDGHLNVNRRPARFRLRRWNWIHKHIYAIFCFGTQNGRLVQFVCNNMNGTKDLRFTHTILMAMATTINFDVVVDNVFVEILNWCLHFAAIVAVENEIQRIEFGN